MTWPFLDEDFFALTEDDPDEEQSDKEDKGEDSDRS